ncbi:phage tail protein [Paenibacillus silvae]|uniref:phage tail protein n=1 Tax=Paenibacillus silvae TaxID=1325358 RepID=UPI0025A16075|nr:phage tail protein [Paenibacillus silvae]MDM5279415.1 phage tail protein [Paenibacillus silvae]
MPQESDRLKLPLPLGNETVSRENINSIFEKIDAGVATQADLDELREAVSKMDIPDASLTEKGKVQLSNKTDGTSETVAATEKAVSAAFQAGVERKAEVVAALNSIGISATTNETWEQLIKKISAVIIASGNAVPSEVLSGATFSSSIGNNLTGTMPNRGDGGTITPGTVTQTKNAGFYKTDIVVPGEVNLVSNNIRKGKSIYNIPGTLEPITYTRLLNTIEQVAAKPRYFTNIVELPKDKTTIIQDYDGFIMGAYPPWNRENMSYVGLVIRGEGETNYNYMHQIWAMAARDDQYNRYTIQRKFISFEFDMPNKRYRYRANDDTNISSSSWTAIGLVDWTKKIYFSVSLEVQGNSSPSSSDAGRAFIQFQNTLITTI